MTADVSKVSAKTVDGAGTVSVTNLDSNLSADFSNVNPTTLNVDWSGTGTYSGNLSNVDTLTISSGTMQVSDTTLGSITVNGSGALQLDSSDASVDVSNVASSIDATLNITTAGSYASGDFTDVSNIDNITLANGANTISQTDNTLDNISILSGSGDDTFSFTDASFSSSDTIAAGSGTDTLSISDAASISDADFTNLSGFETLSLSNNTNSLTLGSELSGAGITTVNGGSGTDTFTLDFSNVMNINMGGGTDTINLTGSATVANDGDAFTGAQNATLLDTLDLTALNSGGGFNTDDTKEFSFSTSLVEQLLGNSAGDLTIKLTAEQAEDIQFTTSDNQVHDTTTAGASEIADGASYALDGDTNIVIDII